MTITQTRYPESQLHIMPLGESVVGTLYEHGEQVDETTGSIRTVLKYFTPRIHDDTVVFTPGVHPDQKTVIHRWLRGEYNPDEVVEGC